VGWQFRRITDRGTTMNPIDYLTRAGKALHGERWKAALAKDLGVTYRSLANWIDGNPAPSSEIIKRVRDMLRVRARIIRDLLNQMPDKAKRGVLIAVLGTGLGACDLTTPPTAADPVATAAWNDCTRLATASVDAERTLQLRANEIANRRTRCMQARGFPGSF
jgi:hypothetical protein